MKEATRPPYSASLEVRPLEGWADKFWQQLVPSKESIARHPLFTEMAAGTLSLPRFRGALTHFYPLVENFPKYMALNLARVSLRVPGHEAAKNWLIDNIKVEQRHAYWYEDWAAGFGIDTPTLRSVTPRPAMDAINHYLWRMGSEASLEEGIAATNLAVEWATGEWTRTVVHGMKAYQKRGDLSVSRKVMVWLRAHAGYDDVHPYEAMELVRRLCDGSDEPAAAAQRCLEAAQRGMAYYLLALDDCYQAYPGDSTSHPVPAP